VTKPFVLFDLGETLVDLGELLACLARRISEGFPPLRAESGIVETDDPAAIDRKLRASARAVTCATALSMFRVTYAFW